MSFMEVSDDFVRRLTLSNSAGDATNDITFTDGLFNGAYTFTKQLDVAWAAGNNAGGLDTGAIANSWYHCFAIRNNTTGVIDYIFSTATTPTMPAGWESPRRVGSINRSAAAIRLFTQAGENFRWLADVADVNGGSTSTSRVLQTVTTPPNGRFNGHFYVDAITAATESIFIVLEDPATTDAAAANTNQNAISSATSGFRGGSEVQAVTNTSSQIATRFAIASRTYDLLTLGWDETPGRRLS